MTRACLLLLALAAPAAAADRKELKPGLVAAYTQWPERPESSTVTRLEPTVAITLNPGESPHPRLGGVAVINWSGYLTVVTPGKYAFAAAVKGGKLTVTVGGKEVLAADADAAGAEVALEPGVHRFAAVYTVDPAARDGQRVELRWRGPGFREEPVPYYFFGHLPKERPAAFAKDVRLEYGRFLFEELACAKCHKPAPDDRAAKTLAEQTGPDLSEVGKRVYPGWLDAWLADPQKVRPHAQMPKLFADDETGKAERYAVVQYLTSLGGPLPEPARGPILSNEYRRSVTRGEALFVTTGCAACHGKQLSATKKKSDDDEDEKPAAFDPLDSFYGLGTSTGPQWLYALGAVGSKTRPEELAKYLQDPLKTNLHGRMPNMALNQQEATDLARHLCRVTDDAIDRTKLKAPKMTPEALAAKVIPADQRERLDSLLSALVPADRWAAVGRSLLTTKGCVNCHAVAPEGKRLPLVTAYPPLGAVRKAAPGKGCLAENPPPGKVPVYALEARHREALAAFLTDRRPDSGARSPVHAARVALKRFNCLNCHQRDGEGGIGAELADRMRLLEKAENADDVQPPRLTQVGHKARTPWLQSVLSGGRARPWMTLRMPQYGGHNVGFLAEALALCEGTVPDAAAARKTDFAAAKLEAGRTLLGKNGHGCISCHDISGITGGGTRGPDLALTSQRVRYDWYVRWLHNPQRLAPGTRMPQVFIDGKALLTTVHGGDADLQAESMWSYLALGPGLPLPAGMEPPKGLVIAVKDRPEILRTFMPDGAGTRAVAVGYPGGVSLTFDAHACRLGYAWEGNFLDASPVWNNRGGAPAKLLGPKFLVAPPGHPWALTAGRRPPDFGKRADDHAWGAPVPDNKIYQGPLHVAFDGYALDPAGNPTFRYRVRTGDGENGPELAVADTPKPVKGAVATGVARSFAVTAPAGTTAWFLGGVSAKEPRVYAPGGTKVPLDLTATGPEAPAVGARVVLPQDGDRAAVLHLTAGPAGVAWRFVPRPGGGWQAVLRLPEAKAAGEARVELTMWALPRDDERLLRTLGGK